MSKTNIDSIISEHVDVAGKFAELRQILYQIGLLWIETLRNGNKIIFCGNGGSAADSQHLAAELTGRYQKNRAAMPGIALTTDTSALTAIANDFGFESVFSRQVEALGKPGDLLIAISTSGNSENIIRAVKMALDKDMKVVGMTGKNKGRLDELANLVLHVPSSKTARIQEMHILAGHIWCEMVEE